MNGQRPHVDSRGRECDDMAPKRAGGEEGRRWDAVVRMQNRGVGRRKRTCLGDQVLLVVPSQDASTLAWVGLGGRGIAVRGV